jgi:hypothetical protein
MVHYLEIKRFSADGTQDPINSSVTGVPGLLVPLMAAPRRLDRHPARAA